MNHEPNDDWDKNRKLVLKTLNSLQVQIRDVAHDADESSMSRHTTVVAKLTQLENRMDAQNSSLEEKFVTNIEFSPVRKIVYGMAGLILSGTVLALLALIINRGVL